MAVDFLAYATALDLRHRVPVSALHLWESRMDSAFKKERDAEAAVWDAVMVFADAVTRVTDPHDALALHNRVYGLAMALKIVADQAAIKAKEGDNTV